MSDSIKPGRIGELIKATNKRWPIVRIDNVIEYLKPRWRNTRFVGDVLDHKKPPDEEGFVQVFYGRPADDNDLPCGLRPPFAFSWFVSGKRADFFLIGDETHHRVIDGDEGSNLFVVDRVFEYKGRALPVYRFCVYLTEDRSIRNVGIWLAEWVAKNFESEQKLQEGLHEILAWVRVAIFAIGFMGCKNVERIEKKMAVARTDEEKRAGQRHAFIKSYTLAIDPKRTRYVYDGPAEAGEEQRRLHICRGHFSTYTAERPLFGKYTGTFWVPAHVRGQAEVGIVNKTYDVKTAPGGSR